MGRELIAITGENELSLTAEPVAGDVWRVAIDGEEYRVDIRELRPGSWSLLVGNRSYRVDRDVRGRSTFVHIQGKEYRVQFVDARRHRLAKLAGQSDAGRTKGEEIRAPIAGRVVKLLVAEGDVVEPGQGVIVLEAMKMENEIRAQHGGTVKRVSVEPGASVENDEELLLLE